MPCIAVIGAGPAGCVFAARMMAYEAYHHGKLQDYDYPTEKVEEAMTHLPKVELTN